MPEQPPTHGGKRKGSGRKALPNGSLTRCFVLTPRHLAILAQWQQQHGYASASEALRHLIEAAR